MLTSWYYYRDLLTCKIAARIAELRQSNDNTRMGQYEKAVEENNESETDSGEDIDNYRQRYHKYLCQWGAEH